MKPCRECKHEISEQAIVCPHCGAPYPAREKWDGWGFEYKSQAEFLGLPWIHICFKYRTRFMPVPARGIIAIGQFGAGVINISQFGIGVVNVAQFGIGCWVLAQFAAGYAILAQIGVYWEKGYGQAVYSLRELLGF